MLQANMSVLQRARALLQTERQQYTRTTILFLSLAFLLLMWLTNDNAHRRASSSSSSASTSIHPPARATLPAAAIHSFTGRRRNRKRQHQTSNDTPRFQLARPLRHSLDDNDPVPIPTCMLAPPIVPATTSITWQRYLHETCPPRSIVCEEENNAVAFPSAQQPLRAHEEAEQRTNVMNNKAKEGVAGGGGKEDPNNNNNNNNNKKAARAFILYHLLLRDDEYAQSTNWDNFVFFCRHGLLPIAVGLSKQFPAGADVLLLRQSRSVQEPTLVGDARISSTLRVTTVLVPAPQSVSSGMEELHRSMRREQEEDPKRDRLFAITVDDVAEAELDEQFKVCGWLHSFHDGEEVKGGNVVWAVSPKHNYAVFVFVSSSMRGPFAEAPSIGVKGIQTEVDLGDASSCWLDYAVTEAQGLGSGSAGLRFVGSSFFDLHPFHGLRFSSDFFIASHAVLWEVMVPFWKKYCVVMNRLLSEEGGVSTPNADEQRSTKAAELWPSLLRELLTASNGNASSSTRTAIVVVSYADRVVKQSTSRSRKAEQTKAKKSSAHVDATKWAQNLALSVGRWQSYMDPCLSYFVPFGNGVLGVVDSWDRGMRAAEPDNAAKGAASGGNSKQNPEGKSTHFASGYISRETIRAVQLLSVLTPLSSSSSSSEFEEGRHDDSVLSRLNDYIFQSAQDDWSDPPF